MRHKMIKNKQKVVDELWEKAKLRTDGKKELTFEQIAKCLEEKSDIPKERTIKVLNDLKNGT